MAIGVVVLKVVLQFMFLNPAQVMGFEHGVFLTSE
jgi:hypothetical protein